MFFFTLSLLPWSVWNVLISVFYCSINSVNECRLLRLTFFLVLPKGQALNKILRVVLLFGKFQLQSYQVLEFLILPSHIFPLLTLPPNASFHQLLSIISPRTPGGLYNFHTAHSTFCRNKTFISCPRLCCKFLFFFLFLVDKTVSLSTTFFVRPIRPLVLLVFGKLLITVSE